MNDDLQLRLATAFPQSTDAEVIRALREGMLLADGVLESEPWLQTVIGRDLRGHLRRAGVLYRLFDMCQTGDLPFAARLSRMPRGNWHWLELESERFVAHVCRTESALAFPEDTMTRQEERFMNQHDLFEPNIVPLHEEVAQAHQLAAWLTFGGDANGQLQHLCWTMPSSDGQEWLGHVNVLRRAASSGVFKESNPRASKPLSLRFKEHIEESISIRSKTDKSS